MRWGIRLYYSGGVPDRGRAWFWTVSDGHARIDSFYTTDAWAAARLADGVWMKLKGG